VVRERNIDVLVAASTAWGKDIVGRAAGALGGAMASDVTGHENADGALRLVRPMYAGALNATVALHGHPQIITIRSSCYAAATPQSAACEVTQIDVDSLDLPVTSEYEGLRAASSERPDVTEARIVVSGGRAFQSSEGFEGLVGALADAVGGAAGSSRALVDAGVTPSDLQVGQTGKAVAPDLYLALGISGAIQHLAGMKNAKIVAAINKDPDAPIFKHADYGLVADIFEVAPMLIEKLQEIKDASS
jgi:electron transfer flavoprotein alpha subunit